MIFAMLSCDLIKYVAHVSHKSVGFIKSHRLSSEEMFYRISWIQFSMKIGFNIS